MSRNGPFQPAKGSLLNDKSYPFAMLFDIFYKLTDSQSFTRSYFLVLDFELFLLSITVCLVRHPGIFPLLVGLESLLKVYQQLRCKAVGIEDVTVVDVEIADAAAYLVLGDFKTQLLLFGEGELLEDDDIAVGFGEVVGMVDHVHRGELDGLRVRGLELLFVHQLQADLGDVVLDVALVLQGKVDEEVVTNGVDVVHLSTDAILLAVHTEALAAAREYGPAETGHVALRHAHLRVDVVADVLLTYGIYGVGTFRGFGVIDGELGDVTLTDDRYRARQFVVHQRGLGFQSNNVVGTLVAYELVGGDVHELDVLRHDKMGGHLVVDIDDSLLQITLEDACIVLRETVDVADADGIVLLILGAVTINCVLCMGWQDGGGHQCHDDNLFHSFCVFIR